MIDRKEVELLIRAQFQGKQTLDGVSKSLEQISGNLDKQSDAAKRGEAVIDELKASYAALQAVQAKISDATRLINNFKKIGDGIGDQEGKVRAAEAALAAYQAKVGNLGSATDAQTKKIASLTNTLDRAQAKLLAQTTQQEQFKVALTDAGFAVDNLANSEVRLRDAAAATATALGRADDAIGSYGTNVRKARDAAAAAARDIELFNKAAALADSQRAARAKAAADVEAAAARRAQDARNRNGEAAGAARADSEAQAALNRQRELAALRADITERSVASQKAIAEAAAERARAEKAAADATAARAKKDNSLSQMADEADGASRKFTTLARASTDLTPKIVSLRDAVNAIINPAASARSSLDGVEKQVNDLAATIGKIKGPVSDYQSTFKELQSTQDALAKQSGLIDNFRRQTTELRAARAAFVDARARVAEYSAAVRQGGEAGDKFVSALAEAEARARSTAAALAQQVAVTRQSRQSLRDAGVATNDLANAEQRLLSLTGSTVSSTNQLTAAVNKYGEAAKGAGGSRGLFGDEGRTTLSFIQRLRGEVLALATAYAGLQGAQTLASGAINSTKDREGTKNQLALSVGNDRKLIDEEYAYVKGQADRIGIEYDTAAKGYAKFSAAARLAGRSQKEVRYIYETFAEVGRVANLSKDDLNGVYKALEQVVSKGKIQAEELRGQLGDRLFGAFQVAAQALKSTYPDLDKALKDGLVSSNQLVRIAEKYRETVADQLPAATQGLAAQQARLANSVTDFKLAVADAGWADAYAVAIGKISEFLKSEDGDKFAKSVSAGLVGLANAVVFVLNNIDTVKLAAEAFLIVFAGSQLTNAIVRLKELGGAASATAVNFKSAASVASAALVAFQAALIGWEVGTYLREKFVIVRQAGTWLVTGLAETWATIKFSFLALWDAFPDIAYNAFAAVINTISQLARKMTGVFAGIARAAGFDQFADQLDKYSSAITLPYRNVENAVAARKAQLQKELGDIRAIRADMLKDDERAESKAKAQGVTASPTGRPDIKTDKPGPTEAQIAARARKIEEITKALESLEGKIDRAQTNNLGKQLEAVDEQYAALKRKIDKLGGAEEAKFMAQLGQLTAEYKQQIIAKFNKDLLTEQENINRKLEAMDAAAGRKSKTDLQARLDAVSSQYEATYREIAAFRKTLLDNNKDVKPADDAKARLDAGIVELKQLETEKFYKDGIALREKEINDLLAERAARMKTNNDLAEGSLITEAEARRRNATIVSEMQPKIEAVAAGAKEFAAAVEGVGNSTALQRLTANANLAVASGQALTKTFQLTEKQLNDIIGSGATSAFDNAAKGIGNAIAGTESWGDAIRNVGASFANFAADFLKQIALMIIKQAILNSLQSSTGGFGGMILSLVNGVKHEGGLVGMGSSDRTRTTSAATWFGNVPRYHSGGMPGLASDEYATILQRGEEVLTGKDPRNILNGGKGLASTSNPAPDAGTRVVLVDDRAKVPEAMASAEGEKVILQILRRNAATVKSITR